MKVKANVLTRLADALTRGEILLPLLKAYLFKAYKSGELEKPEWVVSDANLSIATLKERKDEYNHRTKLAGDYFHPSQLGQCLRKMYYQYKKAPKNPEKAKTGGDIFKEQLTFDQGTYIGIVLQNLAEKAGYLTKREVPIKDSVLRIIGHADGLLRIHNKDYLWEIKTICSHGFNALHAPKPEHVRQVHAYMKALKIYPTIFTYFNKDLATAKEFVVNFNPQFYAREVAERIDTFFECVHANKAPAREGILPKRYPCVHCEFSLHCFKTNKPKMLFD